MSQDQPSSPQIPALRSQALPEQLQVGHVVSLEDVRELDTLIFSLEQRNTQLAREIEELRMGHEVEFVEPPSGWWTDRWVGSFFEGKFRPRQPIDRLSLLGFVPDFFPKKRLLVIEIGERTFETQLKPGALDLHLDVQLPREHEIQLRLSCPETLTPKTLGLSDDDRELAYKLTRITSS